VEGPLPSLLNAPTVGGVVVRLLLLPAILVPAALGLVVMAGQRANFYEASFGTALLAIALIVVFATIVWSSGHVLHSLDVARSRAEENERQTTERLRAANDERGRLLENERHARAAAERASLMKDEFLSTLSHELRTPLNAILGYATLLQSAQLEPSEMAEAVDTIERNARLQAKLIEDLLDMNRIISGKIRLEVQQLDFEQLIDASIETVLLSASSKHIMLQRHVDVPRGIVVGDPARVQQILWNLLSNAVKFTQDGGLIEVSAQQVDSSVEIRVADNGMGIAQEFLPYVFDRFRQADATTTRRHGGLGLGLAIVKHLAELHGGSVDVQSQGPGHGSCFIVRLPATTPQPTDQEAATIGTSSAPNPAADVPLTGLRVLAVDDETDSAILVQRVLQHAGAAVDVVHSPQDARERLARNEYDILISDIGMPGEDGYEFLRRLRAEASQHQTIPALAVTAFARPEDEARARQAGFDGHLPKPIDRQSLVERVARLANVSEV
jgi:signal transduction histidine kinase